MKGSARSISMDLSDSLTSPKPTTPNNTDIETKPQESVHHSFKNPKNYNTTNTRKIKNLQDSSPDDEENNAELFSSCKLKRNSSVSSTYAFHFSAVKKAFSFKRSSSVSEMYCRIHDQFAALPSPTHDEEDDGSIETEERSVKRESSRRRRLIRVCKKLIGL